jgi:hypothetical protein
MPATSALNAHDDYHLEPIFHRYDIDAIISKLLKGVYVDEREVAYLTYLLKRWLSARRTN